MSSKTRIGGHVSAAGGLTQALLRGREIGANTIQIFASSPRQWNASLPTLKEADEFKKLSHEFDISPIFIHAPYLINLASPVVGLRQKSKALLKKNLEAGELIGAEGVIFHLGSGMGSDPGTAREYLAGAVVGILKEVPGKSKLILENSAGGGDKLGSSLEDLAGILKLIGVTKRVAVCFDTAHAFESGLVSKYDSAGISNLRRNIDKFIGWENISCLHVNDSKTEAGSKHDQHQNIGQGYVGLEGFGRLARIQEFRRVPWLLEVPGFASEGPDKKNVDIIRGLFG
ncbi:MAG TPA: deoxyribonuclease IV [Candidatus Paceibacterota bacterium]